MSEKFYPYKPIAYFRYAILDVNVTCPTCLKPVYFPEVRGFYHPFDPQNPQYRVLQFEDIPASPGIKCCDCFLVALSKNPRVAMFVSNETLN